MHATQNQKACLIVAEHLIAILVGAGRWIFDMGDNMAGFATLALPRSALVANQPVTLKYPPATITLVNCVTHENRGIYD